MPAANAKMLDDDVLSCHPADRLTIATLPCCCQQGLAKNCSTELEQYFNNT